MNYFALASADNFRLARSNIIEAPVDGVHGVIRIPSHAFLLETFIEVISPYSGTSTGTLDVGLVCDGVDDLDGLLVDTYIGSEVAGLSRASGGSAAFSEGFRFNQSGMITLTTALGDSSAEITCVVFALYSVLF